MCSKYEWSNQQKFSSVDLVLRRWGEDEEEEEEPDPNVRNDDQYDTMCTVETITLGCVTFFINQNLLFRL